MCFICLQSATFESVVPAKWGGGVSFGSPDLCAGFVGAVAVLREDIDLPARVDDAVAAYLDSVKPAS